MSELKFTDKQQAFCEEYLIDLNGTQAAVRAGYSVKTANRIANQLLSKLDIQEKLKELMSLRSKATQTDSEYVLRRLREIDELDVIDIMSDDLVSFRPLSEWPKSWRISISGLDLQTITSNSDNNDIESVIKKIKWPDKTKNLELIGRHVDVKAWEKEKESQGGDLSDAVNKLIDKLPN